MKYFCPDCGKTTQYNFELPRFCSACGINLSTRSREPVVPTTNITSTVVNAPAQESNYSVSTNPVDQSVPEEILSNKNELTLSEDIHQQGRFKNVKASFTVDVEQSRGESFSDLMGGDSESSGPSHQMDLPASNTRPKQTREEVLAEFAREAGPTRKSE